MGRRQLKECGENLKAKFGGEVLLVPTTARYVFPTSGAVLGFLSPAQSGSFGSDEWCGSEPPASCQPVPNLSATY